MNLKKTLFAVATATLMTFSALPSFGESYFCEDYNRFVVDDGNVVPVNVAGIPWFTSLGITPEITLTDAEGVAVDFTVTGNRQDRLRIISPVDWAEGNIYHIILKVYSPDDEGNNSTNNAMTVEFLDLNQIIHVGAPLALLVPTGFEVSDVQNGTTYSYEIGDRDSAWMDIQAKFLEDPPSNFYMYKTFVDREEYVLSNPCGQTEPGRTEYGPGADRLVVICSGDEFYLKPGIHELGMQIRIVGTTTKASMPTQNVDIRCGPDGCASVQSDSSVMLVLFGFLLFFRRSKNN